MWFCWPDFRQRSQVNAFAITLTILKMCRLIRRGNYVVKEVEQEGKIQGGRWGKARLMCFLIKEERKQEPSNLYLKKCPMCILYVCVLFCVPCRHGMWSWRDLQNPGLKHVCGNMDLQACCPPLDRIWEHTGEGSGKHSLLFLETQMSWMKCLLIYHCKFPSLYYLRVKELIAKQRKLSIPPE